MIIVILSDSYPPSIGGKQKEVELIAKELARLGHRVHVITKLIEETKRREEEGNLIIHRFSYREGLPIVTKILYILGIVKVIKEILREEGRIDAMHANDLLGICIPSVLIGLLFKMPIIVQGHGTDILLLRHGRPRWKYLLYKLVITRAHRIVVNARYAISYLAEVGVPEDKITVIPCPIPVELIRKVQAGAEKPDDVMRIITVANLIWQKGLNYLIAAAKKVCEHMRNVEFIIVGEGPLRDEFLRQIRELKLEDKVVLAGSLPYEEALKLMASADIFVLPSVYDQLPIVILEAMALGKPVVATNVCGIPEVIEDAKTGLLVKPSDVDSLAETILRLIENPELRERLSQEASRAATCYDIKNIVRLHIRNYLEAIRA